MKLSPKAPRKPRKTKDGLRNEAYELLGITEADVLAVPKIEPLLKRANVIEKLWHYLEQSSEDDARKLVAQRYKLATVSQRNSVPFEAYCVAAKIETKRALGLVVSEVYSQTEQASLLMAAVAQPDVVAATIEAATQAAGSREREMLLKHSGFVPVPKTSITVVRGNRNVIGTQENKTLAVLPPIEQTVKRISDRFNTMQPADDTRLLEAPAEFVDAEEMEESGDDS